MRNLKVFALLSLMVAAIGCGTNGTNAGSGASFNGAYEIVATSHSQALQTMIDTTLANGTTVQSNQQNPLLVTFTFAPQAMGYASDCEGTAVAFPQGSITLTAKGSAVTGTFTETNGDFFTFTGTLSASGTVTGTYQSGISNTPACTDYGTFAASQVNGNFLAGEFSGSLLMDGVTENGAYVTLQEGNQVYNNLSGSFWIAGGPSGINFQGQAIGNAGYVTGAAGYTPEETPQLFFWWNGSSIEVFNSNTGSYEGTMNPHCNPCGT